MSSSLQKLASARAYLLRYVPYFAGAVRALIPVECAQTPTMAVTERMVLVYNPTFLAGMSLPETAAVLLHETMHVLRNHAHRRRAANISNFELWNIAADCEINDDFLDAKLPLPTGACLPKTFGMPNGMTAEWYFAKLTEQGGQQKGNGKVGGGACGGAAGNPQPGEPADLPPNTQPSSGEAQGQPGNGPTPQPVGRSEAEVRDLQRSTAVTVKDYAAKNPGCVPGGWGVWSEMQLAPPTISWERQFRTLVRRAVEYKSGGDDATYTRVSRKQASYGYGVGRPVLAASVQPILRVVVAVDTSGSMGPDDYRKVLGEVQGILRAVEAPVEMVACDADVQSMGEISAVRDAQKHLKGGGGTDFRPVFTQLRARRERPHLVIFLTDGHGPAPATEELKTIWVTIGQGSRRPAPWGACVSVP